MTKSYVIKPAAPFERLKSFNSLPDIALRRAIIMQAVIDSTNTSLKKEAKKAEYNSKNWIFEDNENFTSTCLEAGVEPSLVKEITKDLIKLQHNKLPLKVKPTKKLISKAVKKKFIL
ncbi:MAG: hypothetical protein ACIPMY_02890 [Rickettsia endosymbiont of Pentastiridius leporinus]